MEYTAPAGDTLGFIVVTDDEGVWGRLLTECIPCDQRGIEEASQSMGLAVDHVEERRRIGESGTYLASFALVAELDFIANGSGGLNAFDGLRHTCRAELGTA